MKYLKLILITCLFSSVFLIGKQQYDYEVVLFSYEELDDSIIKSISEIYKGIEIKSTIAELEIIIKEKAKMGYRVKSTANGIGSMVVIFERLNYLKKQ